MKYGPPQLVSGTAVFVGEVEAGGFGLARARSEGQRSEAAA